VDALDQMARYYTNKSVDDVSVGPLVVGIQVMFQTVDRLHVEENDDKSSAVHTPGLGVVGGGCCFPMPLNVPERFAIIERFNTRLVYTYRILFRFVEITMTLLLLTTNGCFADELSTCD